MVNCAEEVLEKVGKSRISATDITLVTLMSHHMDIPKILMSRRLWGYPVYL